jgi:hypothetical protein
MLGESTGKAPRVTELDELKALRDQLKETIRVSADKSAAGKPELYLSERDMGARRALLADFEAAILKLEGSLMPRRRR